MKSKITLLITTIATILFVGCAKQSATLSKTSVPKTTSNTVKTATATTPKTIPNLGETSPATTLKTTTTVGNTASIVSTPAAFEKAISSDGTYIIAITKNLTIDKNLVVDGEYSSGKKNVSGEYIIGRKINLYRQDKDKKITARFSLIVPKLTINSPQTNIEHGALKGNVYVSSKNCQLIDTTIKGNLYFTTYEAKSTFRMDTKSKVTGKQELVKPSKTIVSTSAAFEKAIGSNGTWVIAITKDLTFDRKLVVDGAYSSGKKDASGKDIIGRKIDLYRQDKDKNITARLSLTAPKLTINSPQTNIEHGTFKGNIYVSASNFQLIDTKVEGNVYFTTDKAKSTFKMDTKSKVTGKQELKK